MSLPLVTRFGADPLLDLELANKQYVDNRAGLIIANIVNTTLETVNNSTTFVDITDFVVALDANTRFSYLMYLVHTTNATADFKYIASVPAGAAGTRSNSNAWQSDAPQTTNDIAVARNVNAITSSQQIVMSMGTIITGGTAGNLQFQFSQKNATVVNTTVDLEAWLLVTRSG